MIERPILVLVVVTWLLVLVKDHRTVHKQGLILLYVNYTGQKRLNNNNNSNNST